MTVTALTAALMVAAACSGGGTGDDGAAAAAAEAPTTTSTTTTTTARTFDVTADMMIDLMAASFLMDDPCATESSAEWRATREMELLGFHPGDTLPAGWEISDAQSEQVRSDVTLEYIDRYPDLFMCLIEKQRSGELQ